MTEKQEDFDVQKRKLAARLARIEGQVRGLKEIMQAQEPDCEAVAQQFAAARGALDKAFSVFIMMSFQQGCLLDEEISEATQQEVNKVMQMVARYV